MNQPGRFWDKIAEKYSKQPVADEESYQQKLRVTREYFRPDMEVLEGTSKNSPFSGVVDLESGCRFVDSGRRG